MPKCEIHDRRMWRSRNDPLLFICTFKSEGVYCGQTAPAKPPTARQETAARIRKYAFTPVQPFEE